MKKLFSTFLLVFFVFGLFGYYVPFYVIRSVIRSEMSANTQKAIDSDQLVKLSFLNDEKPSYFNWTRKGKEFKYKNAMYDIVKVVRQNNKVTYYCLQDRDEKELVDIFDTLVKKEDKNNKEINLNLFNKLSKYNYLSGNILFPVYIENFRDFYSKGFYKSLSRDINPPPPKF